MILNLRNRFHETSSIMRVICILKRRYTELILHSLKKNIYIFLPYLIAILTSMTVGLISISGLHKTIKLKKELYRFVALFCYRLSPQKGSDQLIVTLYTLSMYLCVHKQLIRTLFVAHIAFFLLRSYFKLQLLPEKSSLLYAIFTA